MSWKPKFTNNSSPVYYYIICSQSGGIHLLENVAVLALNMVLNMIFVVDTFLPFFRAYRDENGLLVFDPRKIRKRYLKGLFVPNLLSILPFTIAFYGVGTRILEEYPNISSQAQTFLIIVKFGELLKLIRLVRVRPILQSSEVVTNFSLKRNSQVIQLWKYVWLIIIVSHWFACLWSFVAFMEAGNLASGLLETPNWIGYWYENNSIDGPGALNPIGFDQDTDRYVLSLFWAIQSITSIGYGNIVPVTVAEYYISCVLMLCAGVMWSYIIGGLVGVASGMRVRTEQYHTRTDQANDLIHAFRDPCDIVIHNSNTSHDDSDSDDDDHQQQQRPVEKERVAKEIRKYIHNQYKLSKTSTCASNMSQSFPVYETLTPELQLKSSFLVFSRYLEAVPYLSSRYLSADEQSLVAIHCVYLEFSSGDAIKIEHCMSGFRRGIFVIQRGSAFLVEKRGTKKTNLVFSGMTVGTGNVLVEDDNPVSKAYLHFLTFSKVVFIPRTAVLAALKKNKKAWKDCARWIYIRTLFLGQAQHGSKLESC